MEDKKTLSTFLIHKAVSLLQHCSSCSLSFCNSFSCKESSVCVLPSPEKYITAYFIILHLPPLTYLKRSGNIKKKH